MNTNSILASIRKHIKPSAEESEYFASILLPLSVKQGEFAEKSGETTRYFIYVNSGCLMTYYTDKDGDDHVIQFSTSGWWTGDLQSFTEQVPATYSTRALTDSEVWLIPKMGMDQLLEKYPHFEKFFRILFQNSLVTHQKRIILAGTVTAEERYIRFRKKYPTLEQYVPLKYIASYLGITPEFLSKIRRKISGK
ncbi:MAG TPA: Crp/Fnr family transcriptional regulator [Cyclobacteriaceae bacterium]|nr:Crp/Fnr family transcriptional regulator [Cyclobacteriaceae bacterium]